MAQTVQNPPAMQETWVQSLGWEGLLDGRRSATKWQPTPVFLPGESREQRSLVGYSPWGYKESDTTEATKHACISQTWLSSQLLALYHTHLLNEKVKTEGQATAKQQMDFANDPNYQYSKNEHSCNAQ